MVANVIPAHTVSCVITGTHAAHGMTRLLAYNPYFVLQPYVVQPASNTLHQRIGKVPQASPDTARRYRFTGSFATSL